ncbi:GTP-binding protein [Allorhizocola rhizosphaerae]|uniref:GTP-binding protein n=1 Tax=Allorhizocola rhizosphaerae TaxID=1872709 RepID=UPI001B8AB7B6|nr:GTP-binding protein [Allorhizocola rhizosphaerae]
MIRFIALSGFLGAGKTTTMTTAAQQLRERGHRVVVITNDQSDDLVDTAMAGPGAGEVTGGCFCCRFEDLYAVTNRLVAEHDADVVIAESVGSCTDLTATVIRPMAELYGERFRVAPLTTVVDPLRYLRLLPDLERGPAGTDLAYLFGRQLEDAAVIGLNKTDLLEPDEVAEILRSLRDRYPRATVVPYAAGRGDVSGLLGAWSAEHIDTGVDLDVDYGRYGVAEAKLAWLNQTHDVRTAAGFRPAAWARDVLHALAARCRAAGYVVGHVKIMMMNGDQPLAKASLIDADRPPIVDLDLTIRVEAARAVVNARVQCEPADLERLVAEAVAESSRGLQAERCDDRSSFKPGQPNPTHRILVAAESS